MERIVLLFVLQVNGLVVVCVVFTAVDEVEYSVEDIVLGVVNTVSVVVVQMVVELSVF